MAEDGFDRPNLAGFPQLPALRDADRMRAVFARHLQPATGVRLDVAACELKYIRNREGNRCMLEYVLRLAEPATGQTWDQAVTGVLYSNGRSRRAWREARALLDRLAATDTAAADDAGAPVPPTGGQPATPPGVELPPFAFDADLDLLIQVFPNDHRLPALAPLLAGPLSPLAPAILASFGPGDWRLVGWSAKSLRYRVDKRATVRVAVRAAEQGSGRKAGQRFYAKVYRDPAEGQVIWEAMRSLHAAAAASAGAFRVAAPVAFDDELRILVQDEVPGAPLHAFLWETPGDATLPAVRNAARALAGLHGSHAVAPRRRSLAQDIDRLQGTRDTLLGLYPGAAGDIATLAADVIDRLAVLETVEAPTHGDLKVHHLVLDGDRVGLIDFDKFAAADPIADVVNILHHVLHHARHDTLSPAMRREVVAAWVEAYFAHAPAAGRDRLPVHYAAAVLTKAAAHTRRDREGPDAVADIDVILREVRAALAGRIPYDAIATNRHT